MKKWEIIAWLAAFGLFVACLYGFIFVPNYQECRADGHSAMYCAATHLVR